MKHISFATKFVLGLLLGLSLFGLVLPATAQPVMLYTHDKIRFITGGIGEEEVLGMRKVAKRYTLNLVFSEGKIGRSVDGHNVDIYNEQGNRVFKLKNSGPMLYVNLPAGNYSILAVNNGAKLRYKFTLEENTTQKIILNWKDEVDEDAQEPDEELK